MERDNSFLLAMAAVGFLLLLLCSCKTKEVIVEKRDTLVRVVERYDTLRQSVEKHDTLMLRDSVVVYVDAEGEERIKYVYKDRYKTVYNTDTIYKVVVRNDSSRQARTEQIEKTTTKKSGGIGGIMSLILIAIVVVVFAETVKYMKK